jgi:hypothetical protein
LPPLKCKESEEIQCPDIKLSNVNSVTFHARIVGNKLIGKVKKLGTSLGIPVRNCAVSGVHIGL